MEGPVAHYILLMTLSPEGQALLMENPEAAVRAHAEVEADEVTGLGMYAVLGQYDIVVIIEAPDNEAAARYSLQLGVKTGAHIETLPAVPLATLDDRGDDDPDRLLDRIEMGIPDDQP